MPREAEDKETIIIWNPVDKNAQVWTYERSLQKYIEDSLHVKPNKIHDHTEHNGGRDYTIPKKYVYIRAPRKLKLTAEQRKAIGKRLQKARKVE